MKPDLHALAESPALTRIAERLARLPADRRDAFCSALRSRGIDPAALPIVRRGAEAAAPLTHAQQRLWFLDQLEGPSAVYNICTALRLAGALDTAALKASFEVLLHRHAALRTAIVTRDGQAVQQVHQELALPWSETDLSRLHTPRREAELERLGREMATLRFDLAQPPLMKLRLARTAPDEHVLWLTLHHMVADGWSMQILVQELSALYRNHVDGHPAQLAPPAIDYLDYAAWQRDAAMRESLSRQLAHWKDRLGDEHPVLALPADHARPLQQSHRGAVHAIRLRPELTQAVRELARRHGRTLFTVMLAAFDTLLFRHTGQHDIRVGTPIANRERAETHGVVGLFANTLVLRTELDGKLSFRELLDRVGESLVQAQAHQDLPFELLVDALQPARDLSHAPLFQAMLIVHAPQAGVQLPGLAVSAVDTPRGTAKFDLTLEVTDLGQALEASFNFASDLFEPATIERMAGHFERLLEGIAAAPDTRLDQLPMLGPDETQQLLTGWNATDVAYPQGAWVHQLFERQAQATPFAPALYFGEHVLSYRELDQRANRLAHHLRARGVGPDSVVGVCLARSVEMVVALMGVMKAGGAYLPLDPDYPSERLQYMCEHAGIALLLTRSDTPWQPRGEAIERLPLDSAWPAIATASASAPVVAVHADDLAYVIYTSGSTGRPKAVAIPHRGLLNRLQWMQAEYRLDRHDRVLQKTPFSFDVSVWEFFWPLMSGAALVVAQPGDHRDSERLVALIRERGVTTLHFVPSMLRAFLDHPGAADCDSITRVICSGEALSHELQQRFFATLPAQMHNLYGPTEASIDVSHWACRRDAGEKSVPIGRPIANTTLHVLDEALNPVPVGVAGELHLGGVGLARGYLGRPELTADKFIPDPFGRTPGARLYKTGDLARLRADGAVEYLGRLDHQVKIRGFRIELDEIESRLRAHPQVADAVVVAREDRPGDKRLVAYWVGAGAGSDDESLRRFLRAELPGHMLPSAFVRLQAMPLSPNGKLDRKALPAPDFVSSAEAHVAPRTDAERALAEVWQDVLGLPRVGLHDNFFRIGGDSILSLQVAARARQRGWRLSPKQMFEHQTVAEAAAAALPMARGCAPQAVDAAQDGELPLTPVQHWFFDARFREPHRWNQAMVLRLRERLEAQVLAQALQALVATHGSLRLRFTQDPEGRWQQRYAPNEEAVFFESVDLRGVAASALAQAIESHGDALQRALDIERGPLLRAALFDCGGAEPQRLVITIHHLAVDGVSWRVLLDDLQQACTQLGRGQPIRLAAEGATYRQWARDLQDHARSPQALQELPHWRAASDAVVPSGDIGSVAEARTVRVRLDAGRTRRLLGDAASVVRAGIEDVLLTALAQSLCAWAGTDAVLVELEGHGREALGGELDISRTVGWFTSRFPVRLAPAGDTPVAALKAVKEQLRAVPRKGVGHGLLRYLGDDATRAGLAALPAPQVCFNYLGQFDRVFHDGALFALAQESPGATRSPAERRTHALDVDGQVLDGVLAFDWTASPGRLASADIEALAGAFIERLAALLDALQGAQASVTPSDFPLARLRQDELDAMPIEWANVVDAYPLAPMQHGLLLHTLLNPGAGMYLMQDRYRLHGEVDPQAFLQAWERVVERHAVLRTAFFWRNDERPLQVVHRHVASPVSYLDWSADGECEQRGKLDALLAQELREGFDLAEPRLIRFRLIRLGTDRYYFTQSYHHILIDAWCFSLLMVDFFAHYQALREGRALRAPLPRPYADFIAWLGRQDPSAARDYWQRTLAGFAEPTPLGIDKLPDGRHHTGVEDRLVQLDAAETAALQAEAQRRQLTVNTCTQAAWALVLAWYSGQDDVLLGTTVAGRPAELEGAESTIGLFINTLPLRLHVPAGQAAGDWLQAVLRRNVEMRQHEHLPLPDVQALSPLGRGKPLFDSLFVFENAPVDRSLDEWKLRWRIDEKTARTHTNYPVTVVIIPGERLTLQISYDRQRFDADAIDRMLGHFKTALLGLLAHPQRRLGELPRLTAAEQAQLAAWNDTGDGADIPDHCMPLFEQQVARTPDAVAARCGSARLSYAELNRRANRIGHALMRAGIGPDDVVALHDRRGLDMLAMILGVFKAGAAYLPLDPDHPSARIAQVLRAGSPRLVLSGGCDSQRLDAALDALGDTAPRRLELHALDQDESCGNPVPRGHGRQLAYVIYTSGSTGVPKGAMVERRGMLNNLLQKHAQLGLTSRDVIAQTAPACFDISVWQFLSGLLCGAAVDIVPDAIAQDPQALKAHAARAGITVLECVPAMLRGLLADDAGGEALPLRWLLPTGEALPPELARDWLQRHPGIPLLNVYGPAECADDVALHALHEASQVEAAHLPIGRPVRHLRLHVVNRRLELLPAGVPGELCIAGAGVGRGYLHDPARTAAAFVPDPFGRTPGERLYRTGDLVRQRADGAYEYLGRIDHQVKLRGHRIELGEIEARLCAQPGVLQAVAVVREDQPGDQRLVAYVVGTMSATGPLRELLALSLPAYMVPAAIVVLDALPLNANGKVDRRALPAPEWRADASRDDTPRTGLQRTLAGIWSEVLGLADVGLRQDFFALGGHSLLATQVVSRVRRALGVELPLRAVFDAPTLGEMAARVAASLPAENELPLQPMRRADLAPLSFAQERMWFLAQLEPRSALYNMPVVLRLTGALDVAALRQALAWLQARHEILRTVIVQRDGQPMQRVLPALPIDLPLDDLSQAPEGEREALASAHAATHARQAFDLGREAPWRARLLRLHGHGHWLLLNLHHIAADGWSLGVLMKELAAGYAAAHAGRLPSGEPLTLQYADFAAWQRQWLQGAGRERQLAHWRRQLGDAQVLLQLPTDRPRPAVQSFRGASLDVELDATLVRRLRGVGEGQGATLFMTLLAGYASLLHRYSGQADIRIGTPVANRHRLETEGLIGLFANTLVMRCRFDDGLRFDGLLKQVRDTVLDAQAHQDLPFEQLVEALQPERDLSRSPLFQAMFILQNTPMPAQELPGLAVEAVPAGHGTAKFELSLIASERDDGSVAASFEYSTDLFDQATIERMARHWCRLLREAAQGSAAPLADWPLLDEPERRQLLATWNDTADATPYRSVADAFAEQARRQPHAVALIADDETLTYRELDEQAEELAGVLSAAGLGPDVLAGICLPRSTQLLVALLAVFKAGAAYLPLDPAYPRERLGWMLEDARPHLLITTTSLCERLPRARAAVLCLDRLGEMPRRAAADAATGQHLAYWIHTSGSTGRPKGVQVTRAALCNLLRSMREHVGFGPGDTLLAVTSLSFDIAALELYLPLVSGGTVLLASREQATDAAALMRLLRDHPVTTMQATPATWRMLLDAGWRGDAASLRLLCGGEAMPTDLAESLAARCESLWNVYGPTETTIWSTLHRVAQPGTPPIGRPLANTGLYILDVRLAPVPVGVAGELYIGGAGLARGYGNRPDLSAERFVPNPFRAEERLYRTGDLARHLPDGSVQCLGRGDRQVKLRGFRIELDEIESALCALDGVRQAAVTLVGQTDKALAAYVVPEPAVPWSTQQVREALSATLPAYMVPARVMLLDALPLTPNGKVDRKALPPADEAPADAPSTAPTTAMEALVASVWEDLLRRPRVGVHDNFFHLGGHSLLAVRVMQRLRQLLDRELPLALLFKTPTLAGLANALQTSGEDGAATPLIALRTGGRRPPLFCVHPAGGHVASYLPLVNALGEDQPVYGLQSRSLFDPAWHDSSIAEMARDYVAAIRSVQPGGPYRLLGWSLGGMVALAMAAELERQGERVGFLGLLDTTRYRDADEAERHHLADEYLDHVAALAPDALDPPTRVAMHRRLAALSPAEQRACLLELVREHASLKQTDLEEMELQVRLRDSANRLMREHRVQTVKAALHVWWAEQTLARHDGGLVDWSDITEAEVHRFTVAGDHAAVVRDAAVHRAIAHILDEQPATQPALT